MVTKAAKRRQMKLKKKAEEELKKKEAEAVKRAFQTYQGSGSSAEEESPKKLSARKAKVGGLAGRSLYKELEKMSKGARPKDKKVFEEELLRACRAGNIDTEKADDSVITMGRAYSKYSGGKFMVIPVVWDTGCSKSIISEQAVKGPGIQMEELSRALNIVTAYIIGVADVFIKTQVTGEKRKMIQCCVMRGHKGTPEILVSMERMKVLRIIHPTFGKETINEYLFKESRNKYCKSKYSELYQCNTVQYYKPAKSSIREPSEEEAKLREKMIKRFPSCFVDKLGPNDKINCKAIKLEIDERKLKF